MAAGESSETEVETFIERQRQMLSEFKPAKLPNVGKQESREPSNNLQRQLSRTVQQLTEKTEREENLLRRLRAMEQSMTRLETQLREKESLEVSLSEQLFEKDQQIENLLTQLNEKEQRLTVVQGALWEKEALEANMQEQLERKEQQLVDSVEQLADRDQQLRNLQVQTREKNNTTAILQERLRVMLQQVDAHEEQLRTKDQEKNELERTLETVRQELRVQQAQKTPDWVIPRNQIHLTEKLRGRGGWGMVVEGKYCGCSVAVKTMYDIILSPHNRRLFEREMDIASKCRHPCLLQFIGATNEEGSPLFVTELMDKSLRKLLEQQSLSQTEISVIALDVARALNYLHQKHPTPILHRDISSANVLLWRQGEQWRAKVSDYGTAKFKQQTMTVAPGAAIYSAPEAQASNQTVKVVFNIIFLRTYPLTVHGHLNIDLLVIHFKRKIVISLSII